MQTFYLVQYSVQQWPAIASRKLKKFQIMTVMTDPGKISGDILPLDKGLL